MVYRAKAGQLIRAARNDVGMTPELAIAARIHQPTVAAYESGRRMPSEETLRNVLAVARLRPSIALAVLADEINAAAAAHGIFDVRVFGSVLEGRDTERSDIDLLVAARENVLIFGLGAFVADVQNLTGFPVDIISETQARQPELAHVMKEAVPL